MRNAFTRFVLAITLALPLIAAAQDTPLPPRVFSHPDRIRYDSQCFTIEGKDTFIFSGTFHYFRCPKELWQDRFTKIKAAGFNTVETYAAWNWHETQMPASLDDTSKLDMTDLEDFLTMAEKNGLYVILRPGPYICAEWDDGGFPQWLLTKKPKNFDGSAWLRSDDPQFIAWSRHWLNAVDRVATKHLLTNRAPGTGGIILYQLENEYNYCSLSNKIKFNYLKAIGQTVLADGIDVPLFTCVTSIVRGSDDPILRQVYDSCNFYPGWNVNEIAPAMADLRKAQPDAPLMTTELQGGWFGNVGHDGSLSYNWTDTIARCPPAQEQNLTLFALQNGDTVTNYYMLFGGTNFSDRAASNITTSYDYSAPIRELGGVGEKYQRVAAIGKMLQEYGPTLARAKLVDCDVKTAQKDVTVAMRQAADGSRFIFVRTTEAHASRQGTATLSTKGGTKEELKFTYNLEPFGSMILYLPPGATSTDQGKWLPESLPAIDRPTTDLPAKITLTKALRKNDPGPAQWSQLPSGKTLEEAGIYDRRFIFYRTQITATAEQLAKPADLKLNVDAAPSDGIRLKINGTFAGSKQETDGEKPEKLLKPGANDIEILYENSGQPNGGNGMEEMKGVRRVSLDTRADLMHDAIVNWKMFKLADDKKLASRLKKMPELAEAFDDSAWDSVQITNGDANQLPWPMAAVFRSTVNITDQNLQRGTVLLNISKIDDEGWVYVNGKRVGESHDWSRSPTFDVTRHLHVGANSIAIAVLNTDGGGGLGIVGFSYPSQAFSGPVMEYGSSAGFDGQWWEKDLDDSSWTSQPIDAVKPNQPASTLLTWYRTQFEMPDPKPGIWVPWVARLNLRGNGMLYLNGHALGRYWEVGPQHDFFLPECWLNFGAGKTNVLAMSLRPVSGDPAVLSAEVVPVIELAEHR
jgi:Glycosyl hydrolases family 35/Glycosyl hydrolases family 2, sugar binding domain